MQQESSDIINPQSVSVALAVYNGEKYLAELLSSLQNQTLQPYELVILDDCSADDSIEIIKAFPLSFEKKLFSNERNMGPVYTFKKLASLCNGNYIAFCDQDDIWIPEKLQLSLSEIKKINTKIPGMVFTDLSVMDEEGKLMEYSYFKQRKIQACKLSFADILFGNVVTGCTTLINKAMARELLKMPLNVIMHDWWMALIAYSFGEYSFVNKSTVLYRSHSNSVTKKDKTSFIKIFFDEYKKKSAYLHENIQQAIEFKKLYSSDLSRRDLKKLEQFINLQHKTFLHKRIVRDSRSLLRRLK